MAKITKILHNGLYILPQTVTDAVLDNSMERNLTEMLDDKLSSSEDDTAQGKITLAGGAVADHLQSTTYTSGFGGKGYEIKMEEKSQLTIDKVVARDAAHIGGDASVGGQLTANNITSSDYNGELCGFTLKNTEGGSYLDVDKLNVRKKAIFRELDIKKIDHIGGANVTSPASCKIAKVEPYYGGVSLVTADGEEFYASDGEYKVIGATVTGYKCYFHAEQYGQTINNDWRVGDQALCHAYNLATPRYYWRLVVGKSTAIEDGYHWVALSLYDCDTDSDEPMADDTIVCFGNRTDTDRQAVILMNSEGVTSPILQQLKGINSYVIADANIVTQLSPTKNIIRGETIELSTSGGNKGVQDLANDALNSSKIYTDTAFGNAKDYTDTSVGSAKEYADGVGTSVTTSVKGYADGLFADSKNYTQEREEYLQSQITANANGIGLCATKTELKKVSDGVDTLATRVTEAEASIKVNAGNIALKANQTDLESVENSVGGLTTRLTTAESQISQNADAIELKASKMELTSVSNAVGGLTNRVAAAESQIEVNAEGITSVVSKQSAIVDDYAFADFAIKNGWSPDWAGAEVGSPVGFEKVEDACQMLIINNVKVGDVVRFKPNATSQIAIIEIIGTDGNAQGAEQDAYDLNASEYGNYTWHGHALTERYAYDIEVGGSIEFVVSVDCPELCVWLSDNWSEKSNLELSHIKAKMSAQSRIEQSADNIRLQVGNAGINLDNQNITLTASKTTINGDLAVSVVKCYYDEAKTQLKSAYNGNGEGTIVYYYPNGQTMKEDKFVSDTTGNIVGMRTTYYKANGEVAWVIDEGGFLTTLPDYWEVLNNGNKMCYSDSEASMMDILTQYLGDSMQHFAKANFSRFVSKSGNYKNYNGKVSKAVRSSETPTTAMLWAGVLIYSVDLYKDGTMPTYIVTYEVCTTALGQVSAITTKKFNNLGEVN